MSFDYSEKQWARLFASMRDLPTAKPHFKGEVWERINARFGSNPRFAKWLERFRMSLVQFDYRQICHSELLRIASRYLNQVLAERPCAARSKMWTTLARLASELQEGILKIDDPRDKFILARIEVATFIRPKKLRDFGTAAGAVVGLLGEKSEREHARLSLYRELFDLWSNLGGALTYEQRDGDPHGSLISFMQATLGPILGTRVSPQTIRTRIDHAKRSRDRDDERIIEQAIEQSEILMRMDAVSRKTFCLEIRRVMAWYRPLRQEVEAAWTFEWLEIGDLARQFVDVPRGDLKSFLGIFDDHLRRPRIDVMVARALRIHSDQVRCLRTNLIAVGGALVEGPSIERRSGRREAPRSVTRRGESRGSLRLRRSPK